MSNQPVYVESELTAKNAPLAIVCWTEALIEAVAGKKEQAAATLRGCIERTRTKFNLSAPANDLDVQQQTSRQQMIDLLNRQLLEVQNDCRAANHANRGLSNEVNVLKEQVTSLVSDNTALRAEITSLKVQTIPEPDKQAEADKQMKESQALAAKVGGENKPDVDAIDPVTTLTEQTGHQATTVTIPPKQTGKPPVVHNPKSPKGDTPKRKK